MIVGIGSGRVYDIELLPDLCVICDRHWGIITVMNDKYLGWGSDRVSFMQRPDLLLNSDETDCTVLC